ncbi:hypothetical protein ElyMa_005532700 [Elysia marginata]|uniref:Uncharacterized protein n=1 Tax=Elysia marginata TaxID=1093978 RepID=A0AAV4EWP2_9GAST|nr:hypothetical protein ElyMa_005532700 [Elysia marginata]
MLFVRMMSVRASLRLKQAGQVLPRRREDPQQPGSANRTSGCQDGHLTRTAKVDRSDVNSKGGLKRRQQLIRGAGSVVGNLRSQDSADS